MAPFLKKQKRMRQGKTPKQRNTINLCIITQFYPPDYAATGQLIEELAMHLSRQGLNVQIFTGQPGYAFQKTFAPPLERLDELTIQRSRISRIWPRRIRGKAVNGLLFCIRAGLHLLRLDRRRDLLLLTTAPPYLSVLGYLSRLLLKLPYVCLLYDIYPDVAVELNVLSPNHRFIRFWHHLNRLIWKQAQGLIVLSPSMKERLILKHPELADKITVIHSWADPSWITPIAKSENWFAQQHGLVDKFTVLYSGNMGRCHDTDTILNTAQQLQRKNASVQFVFIGGGVKRDTLIQQVQELELHNCLFLPYQDKQTLPYSLTACDLSLVTMGSGMEGLIAPSKFYGSLAAGRPVAVICEPHSYLRQIIHESGCGAAFNLGDATGLAQFILCLATDPSLSNQMGESGRKYLETHFTPEIIAQQYNRFLLSRIQAVDSKAQTRRDASDPTSPSTSRTGFSTRPIK